MSKWGDIVYMNKTVVLHFLHLLNRFVLIEHFLCINNLGKYDLWQ